MTNEDFFHFTRCAKAGFLYVNKTDAIDADHERKNAVKSGFIKVVTELFTNSVDSTITKVLPNVEFKAKHGDVAVADIILQSENETNLYALLVHGAEPNWLEIQNVAYTYHIAKECGIIFNNIYIVNIRRDYIINEQLTHEILRVKTYTKKIKLLEPRVKAIIKKSKERLRANAMPANKIDYYCITPDACPFKKYCERIEFPDTGSILELTDVSFYRKLQLYRNGKLDYFDLPDSLVISDKAKSQILSTRYRKEILDKKKLKEWLGKVSSQKFIWFLDFETDAPIVPITNGNKPFTKYPFLYTLCYNDLKTNSHGSFQKLADTTMDQGSVKALVRKFVQEINLNTEAHIVVGHIKKIKECLSNMQTLIPELAKDLSSISNRLVDIQKIFTDHIYYHPSFNGSYYFKNIIPKICSEISYADVAIKSGIHAQFEFNRLKNGTVQEQNEIKNNLEIYGTMDVLTLLKAFQFLKTKV